MGPRFDKRFGRYEVVAEIGRGAMGTVYKARDPKIDRFVAIKAISVLSQSPEEEQDYRKRFFHEAQAAGRLLHPGIVTIFDVGEETESRTPFLVMEYVAGQSLSGLLSTESNKLTLDVALRLAEEIAEALASAHAQGVVHRDIKPANILLTDAGHAKIADFGIAKLNLTNVTLPGHALGTPAYMSPEQVDGKSVDGRSDLFSLGVILYNMVTGHRPFQGSSTVTVCYKVANATPIPATSYDLALPAEIDTIISRAIAKNPDHRYQSGSEMAKDIAALRQSPSRPFHEVPGPSPVESVVNRVTLGAPSAKAMKKVDHAASTREQSTLQLFAAVSVFALALGVMLFGLPHFSHETKPGEVVVKILPAPQHVTPAPSVVTEGAGAPFTAPPIPKGKVHAQKLSAAKVKTPGQPALAQAAAPVPSPVVAPAADPIRLKVEVQHHFADGKLSLWVDEKLAYSVNLHGEAKRHMAVFRDLQGNDYAEVNVPSGPHTLRVNGESATNAFNESKSIHAVFITGDEKILRVDFEKNNREMRLTLR